MEKITGQIESKHIIPYAGILVETLIENRELTGLDLDIESFMLDYVENQPPANKLTAQIHKLMECAFSGNREKSEEVLRYFLGRGNGSTPAGDDHIIGLLGIHTLTSALHPEFVQIVDDLTTQEELTTSPGHYYIDQALNGSFLTVIARVLRDMQKDNQKGIKEHIIELLPIGHSSGIDTAFGMLLGILAMKANNKF